MMLFILFSMFLVFIMLKTVLFMYPIVEFQNLIMFSFFKDYYNFMFIMTVMIISGFIFFYIKFYMKMEFFLLRFNILVMWFILSMMMLLFSNNFFSIFCGWDGLGVSSYFLVIYYQNWKSLNSGILTILTNRIGDCFFILILSFIIMKSDSLINLVFLNKIMIVLLLIMCFTKSAQFPFSSWLPAAMAAPTPVSSLVHSSTLVTAGFYLIYRLSTYNVDILFGSIMTMVCLITMIYSGVLGLLELDFKKIIALSTLSQMSLLFISISVSLKIISFFHLLSHAFFKSLLFMSVGIIIHWFFNNQDLRKYSFLFLNFIKMGMFISLLSLMGLIFSSGFFSKDFILEKIFLENSSFLLLMIFYMSMFLTMFYSLRLFTCVFFKNNNNQLNYLSVSFFEKLIIFLSSMFSLIFFSLILWNVSNLMFLFSVIYMKMWMLLMAVNSVIFFLIFKKLKFLIKIFYSMGFLNKIFMFLLKIMNFTKFMIFKNLEKSNLELVSNKAIMNFMMGSMYKSFSYLNSLKMLIFMMMILIILMI